jgi:hypothetical protein
MNLKPNTYKTTIPDQVAPFLLPSGIAPCIVRSPVCHFGVLFSGILNFFTWQNPYHFALFFNPPMRMVFARFLWKP